MLLLAKAGTSPGGPQQVMKGAGNKDWALGTATGTEEWCKLLRFQAVTLSEIRKCNGV